ncbi:putative uncharacterized protein FLJ43944 [Oryctolagus cuniculus]|uniref:putative uncharacterized protein FLJ43944 n=1 Tax=Oryctolagus cuniculus TaxID=9986 RepID=UPI0038797DEE
MEGQTQNPETQEPIQSSSAQQEEQVPPPQPVEPDELSSPQQEGPGADLQQPEEEASPLQQEAPAQNPFATAEVAGQQGAPAQPPGLPVNTEYSSSNQEQPAQPSESPEIEPSRSQLEAPEKPSALPVEVKSPVQQDPRAQALESPEETIIAQTPQIQKGTDWSPDQNQVHRYNLPNVTIKPADVAQP